MSPQSTLATSRLLLPEEVCYYTLFHISTLAIMDDLLTGSNSDYSNSWVSWFLASKGNEYFCEVEEDYILDCLVCGMGVIAKASPESEKRDATEEF